MRNLLYSVIWIVVYLLLVLTPIFILLVGPERPGREGWREFSVALGFAGLSMLGLQFLLTARIRSIVRPYGIDVVYHFHRQISIVAFLLILAHPIILFIFSPGLLNLLNPFTAPARVLYGIGAILLMGVIILLSLKRVDLKIKYEPWRFTHGLLASLAIILTMLHVLGVGYYISTPGMQVLWITLSAFWIGSLLYVRLIKPMLMLRKPYRIQEVRRERGDTYTVVFQPDGHKGFTFRPGQFAWVTMWSNPYQIREHPFSISSSAMQKDSLEMSIKELGDFTAKIKELEPGTRAYLDGPYGVFSIDHYPAPGYVFIVGGVGITPVMSILRTMADRRDMRPVILFYGNQTWEDTTFREDIDALKERLNMVVVYVIEEPEEDWEGETGFITADLLSKYLPENRMELYYFMCGPDIMMKVVGAALESLGVMPDRLVSEHFNLV